MSGKNKPIYGPVNGVPEGTPRPPGGWPVEGQGGGSNKSGGCAVVLLGLASAPWLADLLLVAS